MENWEYYSEEARIVPSLCMRYSKESHGSGFVNISATFSFEGTYSSLNFCLSICSIRKWYLIGICLVFECMTRFLEIIMAILLSQIISKVWGQVIWMYYNVCIIHRCCVKQYATTTYSASTIDKVMELFFLLNRETKQGTK